MYSTYYGSRQDGYGYNADMLREGFDLLEARADCLGWWSVARRVLRSYGHQPIIRLRRSSDSAERDFYGIGPQGEVSTADVRAWNGWNLASYTEDLSNTTGWTTSQTGGTGSTPTITLIPNGGPNGLNASRIQASLNGGTASADNSVVMNTSGTSAALADRAYTWSFWAKSFDSNTYTILTRYGSRLSSQVITPTWQKYTITQTNAGGTVRLMFGLRGAQTPVNSNTADFLISEPQVEAGSVATTYEIRTGNSAGDSFLVTLYDQSGLARHFTQSTTTLQPIICEQGVPVTENGRLAAKFVAADARRMSIASSTAMFNALHTTGGTVLCVSKANDTAAAKTLITTRNGTGDIASAGFALHIDASERCYLQASRLVGPTTGRSVESTETASGNTAQSILALIIDPDNATASSRAFGWRNGTAMAGFDNAQTGEPLTENSVSNLTLGSGGTGLLAHDGTISELAAFSDLIGDSDRTAYQSRSGNFYGVAIS